jgi:Cu+-exporting ATPase
MTIRENTLTVVSVVALDGCDESTLLSLAASLARGLETPLATAILESARERDVQIRDVDQLHDPTGTGVAASVAGQTVVLGNAAFFGNLGLSVEHLGDGPERLRQQGQHVLFVAVEGRTVGFLGVADAGA